MTYHKLHGIDDALLDRAVLTIKLTSCQAIALSLDDEPMQRSYQVTLLDDAKLYTFRATLRAWGEVADAAHHFADDWAVGGQFGDPMTTGARTLAAKVDKAIEQARTQLGQ